MNQEFGVPQNRDAGLQDSEIHVYVLTLLRVFASFLPHSDATVRGPVRSVSLQGHVMGGAREESEPTTRESAISKLPQLLTQIRRFQIFYA